MELPTQGSLEFWTYGMDVEGAGDGQLNKTQGQTATSTWKPSKKTMCHRRILTVPRTRAGLRGESKAKEWEGSQISPVRRRKSCVQKELSCTLRDESYQLDRMWNHLEGAPHSIPLHPLAQKPVMHCLRDQVKWYGPSSWPSLWAGMLGCITWGGWAEH